LRGRGRRISEFKASLVYRVGSRTARATQRNPVSKNQKKKKKKILFQGKKESRGGARSDNITLSFSVSLKIKFARKALHASV
jgi:hypothetical protein